MGFQILKKEWIHPVKAVLSDMDGVLLDTECLYLRFGLEAAQELGWTISTDQCLALRSLNIKLGQQYLDQCLGAGYDYSVMSQLRSNKMSEWISREGVRPKRGVFKLLEFLNKEKIPCVITTSSPIECVQSYLAPLELYDKFQGFCSGNQVQNGKPAPDIYLYGASMLECDPRMCLALEDSPAGITSAFQAGCLPVMIPDLDQPNQKTLDQCFAIADSLSDVISILDVLNASKQ